MFERMCYISWRQDTTHMLEMFRLIERSWDCLIFIMGIPILERGHLCIETASRCPSSFDYCHWLYPRPTELLYLLYLVRPLDLTFHVWCQLNQYWLIWHCKPGYCPFYCTFLKNEYLIKYAMCHSLIQCMIPQESWYLAPLPHLDIKDGFDQSTSCCSLATMSKNSCERKGNIQLQAIISLTHMPCKNSKQELRNTHSPTPTPTPHHNWDSNAPDNDL